MISAAAGVFVLALQAVGPADVSAAPVPTGPATAAAPAAVKAKAKSKDDPDAVVCRTEAQTGSMIPSRVCRTRRDWDAMREAAQQAAQNIQSRSLTVPTSEMNSGH